MNKLTNSLLSAVWVMVLVVFFSAKCARAATDLPASSAKGSLTYDGALLLNVHKIRVNCHNKR
jgi:hypothetical protein